MYVEKCNALEVFEDDNEGYIFGLIEDADMMGVCNYVEWFKTEKERNKVIKDNNMVLTN